MFELYKAIAGSPITYLAADISANQTTISIADDSALPDAPNICTIGYGENIETIRYGAKSNGVLQNVTRGIEGTPRAWPAGTEVARFFTAYDYNALIENFNSLIESDTNSNGSYIKFDDGTLICQRSNFRLDSFVTNRLGKIWNYPKPFIEPPTVMVTVLGSNRTNIGDMAGRIITNVVSKTNTSCTPHVWNTVFSEGDYVDVDIMAIGRWK